MTEEEVRKIAREEAVSVLTLLKEEIANTPMRADGNINARDFFKSLELAEEAMKVQ
jgi:hypothetical protein